MQRQRLIFIIGAAISAIMVIMFLKLYLDQQHRLAQQYAQQQFQQAMASQKPVLIATADIPRGKTIEPSNVEVQMIPNQYIQPDAATSLDHISGMLTTKTINKGEQIQKGNLMFPQREVGKLSNVTPVGKRAITIPVDNVSSLAGMLKAGDYVDVVTIISLPIQDAQGNQTTQTSVMPLFQNVQVLAVGQEITREVAPSRGTDSRSKREETTTTISPLVTLALSPQEANLIAFVQEHGKIRLILRSLADAQIEKIQPATWETLFQYLMPQEAKGPEGKAPEPVEYVEVYRGLTKELVPMGSK